MSQAAVPSASSPLACMASTAAPQRYGIVSFSACATMICCRCRTPRRLWRTSSGAWRRCRSASAGASCSRTRPATCASAATTWRARVPGRARPPRRLRHPAGRQQRLRRAPTITASIRARTLRRCLPSAWDRFHLAGHTEEGALLIDTHDGYVRPEVWQLYAEAIERFGARSTMIEWDMNVPAFEELERELDSAAHWAARRPGRAAGAPPCGLSAASLAVAAGGAHGAGHRPRPGRDHPGRRALIAGDARASADERLHVYVAHVPGADRRGAGVAVPAPGAVARRGGLRRAGGGVHQRRAVAASVAALSSASGCRHGWRSAAPTHRRWLGSRGWSGRGPMCSTWSTSRRSRWTPVRAWPADRFGELPLRLVTGASAGHRARRARRGRGIRSVPTVDGRAPKDRQRRRRRGRHRIAPRLARRHRRLSPARRRRGARRAGARRAGDPLRRPLRFAPRRARRGGRDRASLRLDVHLADRRVAPVAGLAIIRPARQARVRPVMGDRDLDSSSIVGRRTTDAMSGELEMVWIGSGASLPSRGSSNT